MFKLEQSSFFVTRITVTLSYTVATIDKCDNLIIKKFRKLICPIFPRHSWN